MKELASNVFVENGYKDVTIGAVLTDDGWVCIDAPTYPADARAWQAALQAISPQPLLYVILTDHHRDRAAGAAWLECPVVAHGHTARVLLNQPPGQFDVETNPSQMTTLRPALAELFFSHSLTLHPGGRKLHLRHWPGPAQGSIWVMLPGEQIVFAGDSVVIDRPPTITDGSIKSWLEALGVLRGETFTGWMVVPGRGDVTTPDEIERLSRYLELARERVGALLRADRPRAEVGQLVPEMLELFVSPEEEQLEQMQRRVRGGLEAIYDDLRQHMDGSGPAGGAA